MPLTGRVTPGRLAAHLLLLAALPGPFAHVGHAQEPPALALPRADTNSTFTFRVTTAAGQDLRVEQSTDLTHWTGFASLRSGATNAVTNSAPFRAGGRFHRVVQLPAPPPLTGDLFDSTAGELVVHPVNHASVVLRWGDRTIYVDPVGGATPYKGLPAPDLVLITHDHSDHFDGTTLIALGATNAVVVAPKAVYSSLSAVLKARTLVLTNGVSTNLLGLGLTAVPAYNSNHPKGSGNGYVLGPADCRVYFSGDTGDIPETRALTGIRVAFVCANTPFTMTLAQAVAVIRTFQPAVVYPYHYRNSDGSYTDLPSLRRQVGTDLDIDVRLRKWY